MEDFSYDEPKTSRIKDFLRSLDLGDKKVLLVTGKNELNMNLSSRNLYNVEIRESISFSTYDVLNAETLVLQESAAKKINEVLG